MKINLRRQDSRRIGRTATALLISVAVSATLVFYLIFGLVGKSEGKKLRDYADIKKEGVIRAMLRYNPADYVVQGDSASGFNYELCKLIGNELGLRVEILLESNWAHSLSMLESGRIDVIAQEVPVTMATDTVDFRFLNPVAEGRIYLVKRKSSGVTGRDALGDDTIFLPAAAPTRIFIQHLAEESGETIHCAYDPAYSTEQLAVMVAKGQIRYTVCRIGERKRLESFLPELDCSTPLSFRLREAWLVRRKSPVLADSINAAFIRLQASGAIDSVVAACGRTL